MSEDNKKEKIYAAVLSLFKEGKSIKNIKVSDIADRAGIGKGSIYMHFASKDAVIVDAARYFFDTWLKPFREYEISNEKDFADLLKGFVEIHINLTSEYMSLFNPKNGPDYISVFNSTTLPETIEIGRQARRSYLDILERILRIGEEQKLISYINLYSINTACESIGLITKYFALKDIYFKEYSYSLEQCVELAYDMILRICK